MQTPRNWKAGLVATGAAVGLTLAGLGVAGAQTEQAPADDPPAAAMKQGRGGHKGMGMGALHGEFTTKAPAGGYQTLATQVGEATEVSATSIIVKSEDGFSRTYAVDDGTMVNAGNNGIADVKVGDRVHVKAIVADGKARAVDVHDGTQAKELRGRWAPPREKRGTN
ncbi:MAG TPA: hypothetical protein VM938_11410 [Acidimicrobiales bacterium]|nr:hypothetical protein [Acidimicrobiales bacterium]